MHLSAVLLVAAIANLPTNEALLPNSAGLGLNKIADCQAGITIPQKFDPWTAQVICEVPVNGDQAMEVVNLVAKKHGLPQFFAVITAHDDTHTRWKFSMVEQ
jgi:hypothetical protein